MFTLGEKITRPMTQEEKEWFESGKWKNVAKLEKWEGTINGGIINTKDIEVKS